jgi:3-isopropylmalate/(R)-2-methylmalate dehydratase small subunit
MNKTIFGTTYLFARDDIDTDLIIPAKYLTTSDATELAWHVLEPLRGDTSLLEAGGKVDLLANAEKITDVEKKHSTELLDANKFRPPIVVAGKNFGCGSSREHAVWALAGAGVQAVIAESFARIFFRNSINFGLPTFIIPDATKKFAMQDLLEIDSAQHKIKNLSQKTEFEFEPLPKFLQEIVNKGGLLNM